MPGRPETAEARFFKWVDQVTPLGCWQWTGCINPKGYGTFDARMAHRFSYRLSKGEIPEGLEIDHLCRNRACVRPDHLEAVSHQENIRRGVVGNKGHNAEKTHCKYGHEFTPDNIYRYPETSPNANKRGCRMCQQERSRGLTLARRLSRG